MRVIRFKDRFKVESQSRPGVYYLVDVEGKTCTCPEFLFRMRKIRGVCKHIVAVEDFHKTRGGRMKVPTVIDPKERTRMANRRLKEKRSLDEKQKTYETIIAYVREKGEVDAVELLKRFGEEYVDDLIRLGGLIEEDGKVRVLE